MTLQALNNSKLIINIPNSFSMAKKLLKLEKYYNLYSDQNNNLFFIAKNKDYAIKNDLNVIIDFQLNFDMTLNKTIDIISKLSQDI